MTRVAVIGAGIAGLSAAWRLAAEPGLAVTLFEAADYAGGHTHTVDVTLPGQDGRSVTHGVDTGFLVFNHRTYPRLVKLFQTLGVETATSDMSFSVQSADGLQWSGRTLGSVFAQRRNLLDIGFLRMLAQVLRFNRLTTGLARSGDTAALTMSVGEFLDHHRFGQRFRDGYLLPMIGCIWSCPTEQMLAFPIATLIRFCHNHGLLQITDRPQWYTVRGGARNYVARMLPSLPDVRLNTPVRGLRRGLDGAWVRTDQGEERFDAVVLACHSDQALAILGSQASPDERAVLGAIHYHPNRAVLHTDVSLLPQRPAAWAAWNYQQAAVPGQERAGVCLHYLINQLQPLPFAQPVIVSLNPVVEPAAQSVINSFDYAHPVFDAAAMAAQARVPALQGQQRTWFCGAWMGYGFHEDGLSAGLAAADGLLRQLVEPATATGSAPPATAAAPVAAHADALPQGTTTEAAA